MAKRRYSDDERAAALAALAANGGNVKRTAGEVGVPAKTLEHWAKGSRHPEAAKMGDEKKGPLADAIEGAVRRMVEAVAGKVEDAPLQALATAVGILIDKMQLLRQMPTVITREEGVDDPRELSDDELERRIREAEGGAGPPDSGAAGPPAPGAEPPAGGADGP